MSPQLKKSFLVIVLLILAGVGFYFFKMEQPWPGNMESGSLGEPKEKETPEEYIKMPPFILGKVLKIEGRNITLEAGKEEKTVAVGEGVAVISQVRDGDFYKNIPAQIADIKVSSEIVVYFSQKAGQENKVEKIQIFAFK